MFASPVSKKTDGNGIRPEQLNKLKSLLKVMPVIFVYGKREVQRRRVTTGFSPVFHEEFHPRYSVPQEFRAGLRVASLMLSLIDCPKGNVQHIQSTPYKLS